MARNEDKFMFVVGKLYEIEVTGPGGDRSFIRGELLAFEGTLIQIKDNNRPRIFNTAATSFVGAQEYRVPEPGSRFAPFPPPSKPAE